MSVSCIAALAGKNFVPQCCVLYKGRKNLTNQLSSESAEMKKGIVMSKDFSATYFPS